MSKFENPESENDFLAEDDYLIDEDLRELETQLAADAQFLHATYPSSSSKSERLAKLISACVSSSNSETEKSFDTTVSMGEENEISSSKQSMANGRSTLVAWHNIGLGMVASACLIICVVWYIPQQPNSDNGSVAKSITNIQDVDTVYTVTPVSMSLPDKFLNASQPELEAMFDNMCPGRDDSVQFLAEIQQMDF